MPLPFLNSTEAICDAVREAIAAALPDAQIQVKPSSPGHFEIEVVSTAFAGQPMVKQQKLVLGAIKELMAGEGAPVHAIDRLRTRTP